MKKIFPAKRATRRIINPEEMDFFTMRPERWRKTKLLLMVVGACTIGVWLITDFWALTRPWWVALARLIGVMQ
jgi:hypothetical protein